MASLVNNNAVFTSPEINAGASHIFICDENLSDAIGGLSLHEQQRLTDQLKRFINDIDTHGTDDAFWSRIGVQAKPGASGMDPESLAAIRDTCSWRMVQFLRHSRPTRISEVVPFCEEIISGFNAKHAGEFPLPKDTTPMIYLAVALHKSDVPEEQERCIKLFQEALDDEGPSQPAVSTRLWAQASYGRMGRIEEAEQQEGEVISYIRWHQFGFPPSKYFELIEDPDAEEGAPNPILDHPTVSQMLGNTVELGNINGLGMSVFHF